MRIGIYYSTSKEQGGVYQYSVTFLETLANIKNNSYVLISYGRDIPKKFFKLKNFKIIGNNNEKSEVSKIRKLVSSFSNKSFFLLGSILQKLNLSSLIGAIYKMKQKKVIDILNNEKIDLIFYMTPSNLPFLVNIPFIVTIHDLQHRLNPRFKEVSSGGRWEMREYTYLNLCRKAWRLLAESEMGKKDILKFYRVNENNVVVLPMLPPSYLLSKIKENEMKDFLRKRGIRDKYIFYPAKFWPHKNHICLVKTMALLKKKGIVLDLVLSGSKNAEFSTYKQIIKCAKKLDVSSQLKYLGYVDNKELSILYKCSLALVMPTFFGPSNIPILEAWKVGTAVIYSNILGCRDQLGNAGLLVDPEDYFDIANKIEKIYNDPMLRKELIRRGKVRLNKWTKKDYLKVIEGMINEFRSNLK